MSDELTPKQQKWLEEYLICWNATESARRAGYKHAEASGKDNLRKPTIAAEIEKRLAEVGMTANEVIARLADHARADMSDFVTIKPDGTYELDIVKAERLGKMHLVKKMKHTKYGLEIEFHDSQTALVNLGKIHGLFVERVRIEEEWRIKAIEDIRTGQIEFEPLAKAFDTDLATELFREAGVPVPIGEGTEGVE